MLSKLVHKLFPLSVFAYFISLVVTPSAQAISFTGNLSWQGTGNGTTLTGTFSGNDLDSDGFRLNRCFGEVKKGESPTKRLAKLYPFS